MEEYQEEDIYCNKCTNPKTQCLCGKDELVRDSQKLRVETVNEGTFHIDKETLEKWEENGDVGKGDKVYAIVFVKEY